MTEALKPRIVGWLGHAFYIPTLAVYDPSGTCPAQWSNQAKDPIKIVVEDVRT